MQQNPLEKLLDHPVLMAPLVVGAAVSTFIGIAGGFYVTYKLVVLIGAS